MPETDHEALLGVIAHKAREPIRLVPQATALLVIDVQRYFMRSDGRLAKLAEVIAPAAGAFYLKRIASLVLPNVQRLLSVFRQASAPILFTGIGTRTGDGADLPGWLNLFDEISQSAIGERLYPGVEEADWAVDDALAPERDEIVLQKTTADPFVSTDLEQQLRSQGVRTVVVCGVLTDVCVSATARGAADRDFETIVVEDACATVSETMQRSALEIIGLSFGRVAKTDEIVAALQAGGLEDQAEASKTS